jgi:hypothetical protein
MLDQLRFAGAAEAGVGDWFFFLVHSSDFTVTQVFQMQGVHMLEKLS